MREIVLSGWKHGGLTAMVDDGDFERLSVFRWHAHFPHRSLTAYARTVVEKKTVYMHQMVMGPTQPGFEIDHIDRNGLNNQSTNLRKVTRSQNMLNGRRTTPMPLDACGHHVQTVKKKLSDGSIRIFFYDRRTRQKLTAEEAEERTKL